MAEIIKMNGSTLTVSDLLKRSCDLQSILIIGIDKNEDPIFGVAEMEPMQMVYLMELCKHFLMKLEE